MRKQWPCSKCAFPCSSKRQNLKPIICIACRSKEAKNKVITDPKFTAKDNNYPLLGNSSSIITEMSPSSSSISHENLAFSVTQIGMIFGNLTFEPTLAIPLILRGKSLEPTVKSEVITADYDFVTQVQNDFHCGKPSTTSDLVDDSTIDQIKQEHESDAENEEALIWDVKKVKKKKRSNLPQYTLSPLARFINQLRHASYYRRRRRLGPKPVGPKYDDVLIYEKCAMLVPENEIGLGAELLSPPRSYEYSRKTTSLAGMDKEEKRSCDNILLI